MVQKYQNERGRPYFTMEVVQKTTKDQIIAGLQLTDWIQPYWMTRYVYYAKAK